MEVAENFLESEQDGGDRRVECGGERSGAAHGQKAADGFSC